MKQFYKLILVMMIGGCLTPLTAKAENFMPDATLKYPTSEVYFDIPGSVEIEWSDIVMLVDPQLNDWDEEYANVSVSIDNGEAVEVPAYYIYSPEFKDDDGTVWFEEESYLNIALYEMEQDYDDAESIVISIPEGIVKNQSGEINPAQIITLTKSPYADLAYFNDITWSPEDGTTITQNEAIVKISCGGNPISYLTGTIGYNNYDDWVFGSLEFGEQVTINDQNELVINLTNEAPGEVEIMIPEAYLLIDVDGENQLSASLYLEYIIEKSETSGVNGILHDNEPQMIYTLKGVKVVTNGKPAPGIYVINGKKVVIK